MRASEAERLVPDLLAGAYGAPLGEGLWGCTYDLGDGRVLKLARATGGIGDGWELIEREAAALRLLGGYGDEALKLPAYKGHGDLWDEPEGFCRWLCMERVAGVPFSEVAYLAMDEAGREALAGRMGRALASLHKLSRERRNMASVGAAQRFETSRRDWMFDQVMGELPSAERVLARRLRLAYRNVLSDSPSYMLVHGDVNPSNVMLLDDGRIGLVDFAESSPDLPEVDFAHWRTLGWLTPSLLTAYSQAGGPPVNEAAVHLAGAVNALIGLVLDRRLGDEAAITKAEAALTDCLMAAALLAG
jgi:aminoglycoside phosphotransferase (APT) family kinase protein